jgi:transcriptional regulator with XRE-family HTH domain
VRKKTLTIRQLVRVFLAHEDMTQAELAAMCNLSEGRLSQILNQKSPATLAEALRLADVTGVPVAEFSRTVAASSPATIQTGDQA